MQIPLHNVFFIMFEFINVPGEVNASSLATGLWFYDKCLSFTLLAAFMVSFEIVKVLRQMPSDREKFIVIGKLASKEHKVLSEVIFPGQNSHSLIRQICTWKMIYFLVGSHFLEDFQLGNTINPGDVKVHTGDRIYNEVPLVLLRDMFNNGILGF